MKKKRAKALQKAIQKCASCGKKNIQIAALTQPVDVVVWTRKTDARLEKFIELSKVDILQGSASTCSRHRDRVMRETGALFEVDFQKDGAVEEIAPTVRKGRSWWTLYWRSPKAVKRDDLEQWYSNARMLGRMVNGMEKLPRMNKKVKGLTLFGHRDQLEWDLKTKGYSKVYLDTLGETVVITRDNDVAIPKTHNEPRFTLDELVRLRHFVGMKPDPEMMQGVWLLKKYLNVSVVK